VVVKSRFSRISAIAALALAALGFGAGQANAAQGTFNLPFKAYWGKATLEPGQYKLHYDTPGAAFQIFSVTGNGHTQFVIPFVGEMASHRGGTTCLKLERINGTYYVREFDSELAGRNYSFGVPKAIRQLTVGRADGTSLLTIAVHTAP
jgi:hypothetical protein